ncbi:MAG: c-type cytochrome [Myxococcaceae bacterium]|nr:c-type cytochrome [Myxococcaceae bacterium]
MMRWSCWLLLCLACGIGPAQQVRLDAGQPPQADAGTDAGAHEPPDAGLDAGETRDAGDPADLAPVRWPQVSPVTHDVDADLASVLERPALAGACARVEAGGADQATRLRCGKWMFFNETFGTVGVPTALLDFNQKHFSAFFGRGFEQLGFVADPASANGHPIGLSPTTGKLGNVETTAFTCASCHFGKLADGRYAVGYANLRLDYGQFLVTLGAPLSLSFNANDANVAPAVRARLGPHVEAAKQTQGFTVEAGLVGLSLLGAGSGPNLSVAEQERFLALDPGSMDFLTKPLLDDGVWTVSRIIPLWNLPDASQRATAGLPHERLSWNGGVQTLEEFLKGFVAIGVGASAWNDARLAPLAEYIRSLRAPAPIAVADAAVVRDGARLFVTRGCLGCHDGPSGESSRVFGFAEIGTDDVYAKIYNAPDGGSPCCGLGGDPSVVTRGVKAPRLAGVFTQGRLLHNGALQGLDALFCLTPRRGPLPDGRGDQGHTMTCEGLSDDEKRQLISYLKSL